MVVVSLCCLTVKIKLKHMNFQKENEKKAFKAVNGDDVAAIRPSGCYRARGGFPTAINLYL